MYRSVKGIVQPGGLSKRMGATLTASTVLGIGHHAEKVLRRLSKVVELRPTLSVSSYKERRRYCRGRKQN